MAIIKEFKAMLYDEETVGDLSSVVAPHCHSDEQATIGEVCGRHPFNVMRLEYPASDGDKYTKSAETLARWLETGIVKIDKEPAVYVYEQEYTYEGSLLKNRGLICKVKIEDGVMIPHEEMGNALYSEYKSDRYNLLAATGTNFSSILSFYKDDEGEIAGILAVDGEPAREFTDSYDVTHRIWPVTDGGCISSLKKAFADKKLVIADGHVRYETAVNYYKKMRDRVVEYNGEEEFNYVMMNLMPVTPKTPVILPVHRVVKNRNSFTEEDFIAKLEVKFDITKNYIREYDCEKIISKLAENRDKKAVAVYTGKDYYFTAIPKSEIAETVTTDAEMVQKHILEGALGINRDNFKNCVDYAPSVAEGEKAVREGGANCAIYLNPLSAEEVYGLAECGIKVPKRTNCFYPRLVVGIVMNKFDE